MERMEMTAASVGDFRELMAGFPTGVAVLTTMDPNGDPVGFTCTALCSVSLEPPMLLVCIANRSRTLKALQAIEFFAVNMLHQHGRGAAEVFSAAGPDRFASVTWGLSPGAGLPCLTDHAHTVAECRVRSSTLAGDHTVVIAGVISVRHLNSDPPLLYGLRQYAVWPGGHANGTAVLR